MELPKSQLAYAAGEDVYHTFVTAEKLVDQHGRPAVGRCLWTEKLILICGTVPVSGREEVWFHEAEHAHDYHFRKPDEAEAATDWSTNTGRAIRGQFERQGGLGVLSALTPVAGVAPPQVCQGIPDVTPDEALRKTRFPDLDDLEFSVARRLWESRGLNPWSEQFHIKKTNAGRGPQLKLVLNIEGLRSLAERSGERAGSDAAVFEYGDDPRFPERCYFTVYRQHHGLRVAYVGVVVWTDCFGTDPERLPEIVVQKPHFCFERCAEAAAIRKGFPDEARDMHVTEEMLCEVKAAAKSTPTERYLSPAPAGNPDDCPGSSSGMHLRLIDLGLKTEAERKMLIRRVASEIGDVPDGQEAVLYAKVIEAAKAR